MKYCVYAIKSEAKRYVYIGFTSNLTKRLAEHNSGKTNSNKAYLPFKLFYYEEFYTEKEAINREKELKSGYNREILRSIAYNNGEVPKWLKGTHC